jgi:hypothetical protein
MWFKNIVLRCAQLCVTPWNYKLYRRFADYSMIFIQSDAPTNFKPYLCFYVVKNIVLRCAQLCATPWNYKLYRRFADYSMIFIQGDAPTNFKAIYVSMCLKTLCYAVPNSVQLRETINCTADSKIILWFLFKAMRLLISKQSMFLCV